MFYLRRTTDENTIRRLTEETLPGVEDDFGTAMWLLWNAGTPVGFCGVRQSETWSDWAFLSRSGILPAARGRGLQRRMVAVREAWARSQGLEGITTYVSNDNVPSLMNLLKCGFFIYDPEFKSATKPEAEWRRGSRDGFIYLAKRLDGRQHRH